LLYAIKNCTQIDADIVEGVHNEEEPLPVEMRGGGGGGRQN
jgi:hypothetical protein